MSENTKTLIPGYMYEWNTPARRTSFIVPPSDPSKDSLMLLSKMPFMYLESKEISATTRFQFWFLFVDEDNNAPYKGYLFSSELSLIAPVTL